jgi:hypothetical protein
MKKTHSMNMPIDADLNLMQSRAEEASRLLKALGNAQRLRVLCLLLDGEMSVGQINEYCPNSASQRCRSTWHGCATRAW